MEICEKIKKSINTPNFYLEKSKAPHQPIELSEVSLNDVKSAVMSLTSKSSTSPDEISNKVLEKIPPHISKDLTLCINKSLNEAKFPEVLKISKITPIPKPKKDRNDPNSWPPITQLSPMSKMYK